MKRTLLSLIAGIMIVGTAFALPSADDRRAECAKQPLDRVWVEKTKACIRINPCEDFDQNIINKYCINGQRVESADKARLAMERYAKNVLGQKITEVIELQPSDMNMGSAFLKNTIFLGAHMSDGGYYVFHFWKELDGIDDNLLELACWAYGKHWIQQPYKDNEFYCTVNNETECVDIADFASLVSGKIVNGETSRRGTLVCKLTVSN